MGDSAAVTSETLAPAARALLTPERLDALRAALEAFPPHLAERGKRYATAGRVEKLTYDPAAVRARVRGTWTYTTGWSVAELGWQPACSCPAGPECKHAYALGCVVLLEALPAQQLLDPDVAGLLPERLVARRVEQLVPAAARPRESGSAPRTLAPAPATPDERALERIRSSRDPWERMQAVSHLFRGTAGVSSGAFEPPFSEIVHEPDADLRCWMLAQAFADHFGEPVPAVLERFRGRRDLRQRQLARAEAALVEQFSAWVHEPRGRPDRTLRLEFGLVEPRPGAVRITFAARLSSARLRDRPRSAHQLRHLYLDADRHPGLLPPEQMALLEILQDPEVADSLGDGEEPSAIAGAALVRVLLGARGSPLVTWAADLPPGLADRAGVVPGNSVQWSAGVARIEPALDESSSRPRIELHYVFPDGRARRERDVITIRNRARHARRDPTLVLAGGAFWSVTGEPPAAVANLFAETGGFDLPVRGRAPLVASLARSYPRFRETVRPHTRTHAVRTACTLDLREDDWLQIRAYAIADPAWRPGMPVPAGLRLFEYEPEAGWTSGSEAVRGRRRVKPAAAGMSAIAVAAGDAGTGTAPPAAPAADVPDAVDAWLDLPDASRTEPLVQWLESTGALPGEHRGRGGLQPVAGDREIGWWVRLGSRTSERFERAWDERPGGVEWYGNAAARRLFAAPSRVAPRVRVVPSGVDWFSVSAEWEAESLHLTDEDLARLRASTAGFVKLPSGWTRKEQGLAALEAGEALAELGLEPGAGEQRMSLWQLAHARPEALAALEGFADGAAMAAVHDLRERVAGFSGLPRIEVPAGVVAELRPYQRDGLDFLAYTSTLGLGAVLADDMGLGKTVQALAWLAWLGAREPRGGPSLVVCPTSVLHNWEREANRFVPGLRVLMLAAGAARHELRREIPRHDLVVTNYALLRRDLDQLEKVEWRAAILDEAQNIKNPDAAVSRAARLLRARYRLALTGTPLENRALDLWSLMAFVNPGYLGSRAAFSRRYDRPDATPQSRRLLSAKLRPVVLRRLKQEVAPELPPRIEERRDCEMTPGQRKLYLAELARGRQVLQELTDAGKLERSRISILAVLTRLRQICCHPALAGGRSELGSGKFDALFEVLEPLIAEGHKVIVFSQFVECLKLIAPGLRERGISHHTLTGQTTKRAEVVAAFERDPDPCVFLVSLRAGGTGLNLTAANYVVLFDPWWNPAVEAQAIDRTHRIGQDRTVIAYRMLTEGSVEERIWDLQQRKAALVRDVLGEDGFAKSLTRQDLEYLLAEA